MAGIRIEIDMPDTIMDRAQAIGAIITAGMNARGIIRVLRIEREITSAEEWVR
jgi:hypothetical protein